MTRQSSGGSKSTAANLPRGSRWRCPGLATRLDAKMGEVFRVRPGEMAFELQLSAKPHPRKKQSSFDADLWALTSLGQVAAQTTPALQPTSVPRSLAAQSQQRIGELVMLRRPRRPAQLIRSWRVPIGSAAAAGRMPALLRWPSSALQRTPVPPALVVAVA
jgi:hypothetical protein